MFCMFPDSKSEWKKIGNLNMAKENNFSTFAYALNQSSVVAKQKPLHRPKINDFQKHGGPSARD